jgi:hypothetical protein
VLIFGYSVDRFFRSGQLQFNTKYPLRRPPPRRGATIDALSKTSRDKVMTKMGNIKPMACRKWLKKMVDEKGFEPSASSLRTRRSPS